MCLNTYCSVCRRRSISLLNWLYGLNGGSGIKRDGGVGLYRKCNIKLNNKFVPRKNAMFQHTK